MASRWQQMSRIWEISQDLTSTVSLDRLLDQILEATVELTDCESAAVLLFDEASGDLRFVAASLFADQLVDIPVPVDASIAGAAFSSGEPVLVPDVSLDPRYYRTVEQVTGFKAYSLLAVPLQFRERRIGVLEVQNKHGDAAFDQQDLEGMRVLAAQATVAIENARLVEALQTSQEGLERRVEERTAELSQINAALQEQVAERAQAEEDVRRRVEQLDALRQISLELTAQLDLGTLLHSIVSRATALLGDVSGGFYLYQPEEDVLEWITSIGPQAAPAGLTLRRGEGLCGRVWQTGASLIVDDYRSWAGRAPAWDGYEIGSSVGVPVRWGEHFLGVLNVFTAESAAFSDHDIEQLSLFASQAAIAVRNARLYEQAQLEIAERARIEEEVRQHRDQLESLVAERVAELEQANQRLEREIAERQRTELERVRLLEAEREQRELAEALRQASATLSGTLDYDQVLDRILQQVSQLMPQAAVNIMLIENGEARVFRGRGYEQFSDEALVKSISFKVEDVAAFQKMRRTGQPLVVPDVERDEDWVYARPEHRWIKSYVGVPIRIRDEVIGFLNANSAVANSFGQTDANRLGVFADHAAIAIGNARLYEQAQRELVERVKAEEELRQHRDRLEELVQERTSELVMAVEQLEEEIAERQWAEEALRRRNQGLAALHDTARTLSATLRLDKLMERALQELERVLPYDAVSISMLHDERGWTVASRGFEGEPSQRFQLEERPLLRRVIQGRVPVIMSDVSQDLDWSPARGLERARAWLGVPLITKDQVIGVLAIVSYTPRAYDEQAASLAFAFAHQVALAIENSRLYEQVQAKLREATLLHSVTAALSFTLELDRILPYVAHSLCEILNGTSAEIYSLDEETNVVTLVADYVAPVGSEAERHPRLGETERLDDLPVIAERLSQRRPLQVRADDPDLSPSLQGWLASRGAQAMLMLPMVVGARVLGFAQLWESQAPRQFTEGEITTGQALIHQAAIAIYNARLVEELRQYTAELEAQNAELDAFAHTVAHDLKNPLTSLIGYSRLTEKRLDRLPGEKLRRNLQVIGQNAQKMHDIIDELLLLASVRKVDEVERGPLDMAGIVAEAQSRLSGLVDERQVDIILPDPTAWPEAVGYGPWIEEVWVNYLSNAIKYGGEPPRVELGATPQENGSVRFWVRDNGAGLTDKDQARLFTPFTRLHQVYAKGHGLGLSIVQRIVEKLGGQVGVESSGVPGEGSLFFFTLPIEETSQRENV